MDLSGADALPLEGAVGGRGRVGVSMAAVTSEKIQQLEEKLSDADQQRANFQKVSIQYSGKQNLLLNVCSGF